MKIAYAGLANSHPFADAEHIATLRDDVEFHVWDDDASRTERFVAAHPGTVAHHTFDELVTAAPDGALITVSPNGVAPLAKALLGVGCAVVITKPAATNAAEIAALERAVLGQEHRVLTASILRFAPDAPTARGIVERCHVVASHDISYWRSPESRWQDEAGGLVPMMGAHGFELLELLLGPTMTVTECAARKVTDLPLTSPDIAHGTARNADGALGTFKIDGTLPGQLYRVEYTDADGSHVCTIGESGGDDPFGSIAMSRHLLAMADGAPSPLPWSEARTVLRCIAEAHRLAQESR